MSPDHFGAKQKVQSGESNGKAKKSVLQDDDDDGHEEEEIAADVEVDLHKQGDTKEITNEGSTQVNCSLEDEIREFSEMHSLADYVEETQLGIEDFGELVSGLNEDNLVSSESEVEDTLSSSEDEKEVSVLDRHEGILIDLFKEDGKLVIKSQGHKNRKERSASLQTTKKTKVRAAAATKGPTKLTSTSAENSVDRMGRFMSKLKVAAFPLKKNLTKGRSIGSEGPSKVVTRNKGGNKSATLITYEKRGTRNEKLGKGNCNEDN